MNMLCILCLILSFSYSFFLSQNFIVKVQFMIFVRRQYDMTEKIRIVPDLAKQKNDFFIIKNGNIF